jgi:hypothetical protein
MNLSNKKALVYDLGLFTENALRLVRDCAEVKYYVPNREAFPEPFSGLIGKGLDGLERVDAFEDHIDEADFLFIPDTTCGPLVEWLKSHDYPVAGAGAAEKLELDRWHGRTRQKANGLAVHETHRIKGITALRAFCEERKDYYVKVDNEFRGISESFKHHDKHSSEARIDWIAYKVGPYKEDVVFICEELLPGVEPGIDAITWEDELLFPTTAGYEMKGSGIISRVYRTEAELPEAIRQIHAGMAPEFKRHKTRFFYSAEFKIDHDRVPYLIDPTIRLAAPGVAAIQCELIENYSEVIYGMATGVKTPPAIKHKYAIAISIDSAEAAKTFVNVSFPKEMRRWVKLRMAVKHKGDYYSVPPFDSLGCVIALGDSVEDVVKAAKERAEQVDAISVNVDFAGIEAIEKHIQEGKKYGINF